MIPRHVPTGQRKNCGYTPKSSMHYSNRTAQGRLHSPALLYPTYRVEFAIREFLPDHVAYGGGGWCFAGESVNAMLGFDDLLYDHPWKSRAIRHYSIPDLDVGWTDLLYVAWVDDHLSLRRIRACYRVRRTAHYRFSLPASVQVRKSELHSPTECGPEARRLRRPQLERQKPKAFPRFRGRF